MRTWTLYVATLVSVLGIAAASQAAIVIDFEIGGQTSVVGTPSSSVTVDIFLTATGATEVSGYQFAILYQVNDVRDGAGLVQAPTHAGAGSWVAGGAGLALETNAAGAFRGYAAAISASTISDGDEITAADGAVKVGTLTFHVFPAVATNGIDITGCFNCTAFGSTGDGATGDILTGGTPLIGVTTFNGVAVNVPEPTTASLLGLGLLGIGAAVRRRKAARR